MLKSFWGLIAGAGIVTGLAIGIKEIAGWGRSTPVSHGPISARILRITPEGEQTLSAYCDATPQARCEQDAPGFDGSQRGFGYVVAVRLAGTPGHQYALRWQIYSLRANFEQPLRGSLFESPPIRIVPRADTNVEENDDIAVWVIWPPRAGTYRIHFRLVNSTPGSASDDRFVTLHVHRGPVL